MANLNSIKPNPSNPRIIKDEKFEKLKQSITDFPQMMELRPMIVDESNTLLGGNMRFKALQDLGYKEIPDNWIKKASELTEEQKKEFIIKDNVGFGEWEWEQLANEWDVEQLTEWGLDIPDYAIAQPEAIEDDYEIPDTIETDIVLGDLFEIGQHRLLCGDSTDSDQVEKLTTQKPIELANWFFNKWGNDNDLIADLYLGGGTTMVASHQLNRKCYGMELDPKYCQVIVDRMLKLDPTIEIKRNGEKYTHNSNITVNG